MPNPHLPSDFDDILRRTYDYGTPVYEQSVAYFLHYIAYNYTPGIDMVNSDIFPFITNEKETFLICPKITHPASLEEFASRYQVTKIKYLSQQQTDSLLPLISTSHTVVEHSPKEVFYHVATLTQLPGKDFANLRHTRNTLLTSPDLAIKDLDTNTLPDATAVLEKWTQLRGHLYAQNRLAKEIQYVSFLAFHPSGSCWSFVYYWQNRPIGLGVLCASINPLVGIIHIVKASNHQEEGGHHGMSDAIYLHLATVASRHGFEQLNDGDLGREVGTIEHKLRFKPIRFSSTYTIELAPL